jgi:hypothetical protein
LANPLASGLDGDRAAFVGGLDALLQNTAGGLIDLDLGFAGHERIGALRLAHTFNADHSIGERE